MPIWDGHYIVIEGTSLILGVVLGYVMHRSNFCMAGAFRDLFLFRRQSLLRPMVLLFIVSAVFFETARLTGLLPKPHFPFFAPPSLMNLAGGIVFGFGMVLAGGCVVGILYKMGSGSLSALLGVIGLLVGSALFAEIYPAWVEATSYLILPTDAITLPELLDVSPTSILLPLVVVALLLFARWRGRGEWTVPSYVEGYIQPWQAALVFALSGLFYAVIVGIPFGITTSYAKAAGWFESLVFPEHFKTLVYFSASPVRYIPPFSDHIVTGGSGPGWDAITLIQLPLIVGVLAGSAFSTIRLGEFRPCLRIPFRQVLSALIGGTLMGLASRMTPGCNIWHLWGGLPILSLQSLLFFLGLLPGAWMGSRTLLLVVLSKK